MYHLLHATMELLNRANKHLHLNILDLGAQPVCRDAILLYDKREFLINNTVNYWH